MQRVTISLDDDLATQFDAIVRERAYASRSEAVRDLVRELVDKERLAVGRSETSRRRTSFSIINLRSKPSCCVDRRPMLMRWRIGSLPSAGYASARST